MKKKMILSLMVVFVLSIFFGYLTITFSQGNIKLKAIKNGDKGILKILAPKNVTKITCEIYSKTGNIKASIYRDYYGIVSFKGFQYNEFIISTDNVKFNFNDKLRVLANGVNNGFIDISTIPYTKKINTSDEKYEDIKVVKVMTYNIHHGKDRYGRYTLDNIIEFIKKEDPDILGLQEVDKNMLRSGFKDQAKKIANSLSMYYAFGSNEKFLYGKYGNAVLSKYPIIKWDNIKMDGKENRGLLIAEILLDKTKLNFLVTHLGTNSWERDSQFKVLNSYLKLYENNTILIGDLNEVDYNNNILDLEKSINDVANTVDNRYSHTITMEKHKKRIDYIFADKNYEILDYKVKEVDYSDHYPVISYIKIRE
ncbi:endonuclease/exonuclease/phosphatase family protein [Dethiothermospora halolimnae]|uniref:endonuclease/exonuclease/phosphatase family protein n=1 Tax=Dethiothermospora halolimnae TaxID=3114390 RepID=UPI003CCC256D